VGYTCEICGRYHDEEMRDVRAGLPEEIFRLPEAERERRVELSPGGDFASLVDADRHFVRALIELSIPSEDDCFGWGVWVRLTRADMVDVAEAWTDDAAAGREFQGWLATDLPAYGETLELPGTLELRTADVLPLFEVGVPAHRLAVEQREGISLDRARELADPYRQAVG
jgi:hypothetical protein